jgi:chaperonin GroEL
LTKHYSSGSDMNQKILNGINILADNVASTLGPRGRNVILQEKNKRPIITKDGVTVAEFVDLEDPIENAGAQIIKQAAMQTNLDAGDGTTTATVLSRAILTKAQKYISSGVPPIELQRGIEKAVEVVISNLKDVAQPISCEEDICACSHYFSQQR